MNWLMTLLKSWFTPDGQTPPAVGVENPKTLALAHAKDGYKNAQEVIRFMDTKTGVFTGFALLGIGLVLQVLKEAIGLPDAVRKDLFGLLLAHSDWFHGVLVFMAASLVLGVISFLYGLAALTARGPAKSAHTILFPFYDQSSDGSLDSPESYVKRISLGMSSKDIAEEYENQILNVGTILFKKIKYSKRAVKWFRFQVVTISAAALLIIFQLLSINPSPVPAGFATNQVANAPAAKSAAPAPAIKP